MRRRPGAARGAIAIVVVVASGWLLAAGALGAAIGAVLVSDERATSLADAAAHAAAGELVTDGRRDDIAGLLGREAYACWWAELPRYAPAGARFDDSCRAALGAAGDVLSNRPGVQLLSLTVVADPRDNQFGSDDLGRLEVTVTVAVERRIPVVGRTCDRVPDVRPTLCFAVADSAAQQV